jgi:hypothetical protein
MNRLRPIADRVADHDRRETMLAAVHYRGPDAAASRHPGDQHRVDAQRGQRRRQRGAEERTGVLLGDDDFARLRLQAVSEPDQLRIGSRFEASQRRHFAKEHSAVLAAGLIRHIRVQDGEAVAATQLQQLDGRSLRRRYGQISNAGLAPNVSRPSKPRCSLAACSVAAAVSPEILPATIHPSPFARC